MESGTSPEASRSGRSSRPLRLLIVEDSPPDADLTVATLKRAGYSLSFDVVDTPEDFRDRLAQTDYDIILSDHNLKTWTGTEALEILQKTGKAIPFVVLTATLGDEAAVDYVKRGAADYLLKHRLDRLPVAVGRALQEKAHREESAHLQEQILAGKREWELTFDTVSDPVFVLDDECRIQRANRAAAETLGLPFSQMIGKHCYEVVHGLSAEHPDCPHVLMRQTGQETRRDISEPRLNKIFQTTTTPLRDPRGEIRGCTHVMHDITDRRRAEDEIRKLNEELEQRVVERTAQLAQTNEALRNSEKWLSTTLGSIGDAVIATDQNGSVTFLNAVAQELTGWTQEEAQGKSLDLVFDIINQETRQPVENPVKKVFREGKVIGLADNTVLISKDRREFDIEDSAAPIVTREGERIGVVLVFRDVTERRRIEEERERFFTLSRDMICIAGFDGYFKSLNPAWEKTLGFTPGVLLSAPYLSFVHPDDHAATSAEAAKLATGLETISFENRYRCKDGSYKWILWSCTPSVGHQLIYAVAHDITERKRAEEALREAEREAREALDLLDATRDGVFIFDPASLRFSYVNQGAINQVGYSREELLARTPLDIKPEFDEASFRKMIAPMIEGRLQAHTFTTVHRRKDGKDVPVEIILQRVATGASEHFVAMVRDITERKRAEEALLFNQQRLAGMVDSAMDAVITVDDAQGIVLFNHAAEEMFRCKASEALGQPIEHFIPERFRDRHREHVREFAATGVTSRTMAVLGCVSGRRTNGEEFPIEASISQIQVGGARLFTVILRDITERKKAEEVILRAKEEAERSSKFKNQFLSTMSHELRTPLNAVLGFSELLKDETYGPLNERQQRYVSHIHSGGQHLLRLISDVLDLSKIEAGRMELAIESVAVKSAIGEVLSALRPLAEKKSLDLSEECEPGLAVRADVVCFKQVLMNLVGNAIKFTPEGGRIALQARKENGAVRVEVRDSGPGIPPKEQKRIFEAFVRLQKPGASGEGTGLGLAITQRLVDLHGGRMGLESELGKGSCFFFSLPAAATQPEAPAEEPQAQRRPGGRVLVIEDDPVAARLIEVQLQSEGYEVSICNQPEVAVTLAATLQPRAITLDVLMKPTVGWEVLTQLKNDARTSAIPVIMVTIVDQPAVGVTLGAEEYLVKPVDKEALLAAVRRCLRKKKAAQVGEEILVVEDDASTREMITEMLQAAKFTVAAAATGGEARAYVTRTLPRLVILDLLLPEVSGFELLTEWKANPRTAKIPVFVLTGKKLSPTEEGYLRANAESLHRKQQPWQQALLEQIFRATAPALNAKA